MSLSKRGFTSAFAFAALTTGTVLQSCTLSDVRDSIVDGSLGFAQDWTATLLGELIPDPQEVVNPDETE